MIWFSLSLVMLTYVSFLAQEFMPVFDWAFRAEMMMVPVFFFLAAVSVDFSIMLLLAMLTGLLWDARHLVIAEGQVDLPFGYSIVLYGLLGCLMQGVRPLFRKGRWEWAMGLAGLAMVVYLTGEYLLINVVRGDFYFPLEVGFKILATALLSMLWAPLFLFFLHKLAAICRCPIRLEERVAERSGA
ncbi:MAG: hypothetical protein AAF555_09965 [Verrucomicrobiota bacterium]